MTRFVSLWWYLEDVCSPFFLLFPQSGLICSADDHLGLIITENLHHTLPHNVFIPYDCEVRAGHKITRKQKVYVVASRENGKRNLAYYRSEAWGSNTGIWTQDPCQLNSVLIFLLKVTQTYTHTRTLFLWWIDLSWLQCGNWSSLSLLLLLQRTGCGEEIWWKHSCLEIRTGSSLTI